jgi:hypothetical protein
MDDQLKLIRGKRIQQQLDTITEDSTYDELFRDIVGGFPNTAARQNATNPVQVSNVKYVAYQPNGILKVQAEASSNGHKYQPTILFQNVDYTGEGVPGSTTFRGTGGEHHIEPIDLNHSTVKVRCTCLDFYHRFSQHNQNDGSLAGSPMPPYQKKPGSNRPPVNPKRVPGVCKHLIKMVQMLRQLKIVK